MRHSDTRRTFRPSRVFIGLAAFAACAMTAALAHVLVGMGRDIRPASGLLAILLVVTVIWRIGWQRDRIIESLMALVVVELLFVAAIGWIAYGGVPRLDSFFFSWFVPGNLFVALPWLLGIGMGTWFSRRRSQA